jgi:GT2 family glycosyltransferase
LSHYFLNISNSGITKTESIDDAYSELFQKDFKEPSNFLVRFKDLNLEVPDDTGDAYLITKSNYARQELNLNKPVTIIIVSFNISDILRECINSILRTTDHKKVKIVIIDNNSNAETVRIISSLEDLFPNITAIYNKRNLGFTAAVNQGLEKSDNRSDILLLNNDSIATNGWLEELQTAAYASEDIGISAPQQILLPRTKTIDTHVPSVNINREIDVTVSFHHDNFIAQNDEPESFLTDVNFIPFFCVYIRRDLIDQIGSLDAKLGRHYRSDRIYCNATIHYANKRIVYTPRSKVYHFHQQSTQDLKKNDKAQYQNMFVKNLDEKDADLPFWI